MSIKDKAAKVFEMFIGGTTDGESAAAYDRLCEMHVKIEDVSIHVRGNIWETKNAHVKFEVSDDTTFLVE